MNRLVKYAASVLAVGALTTALAAPAANASDGGNGIGGSPVNCTGNWTVGPAVPAKASDGRVIGYSQMWWSNSCQGNWTRAWTVSGQATTMESTIAQGIPPGPNRRFAIANDYANVHFTLWVPASPTEKMCGSTQMWDTHTLNWAFTGVYCRT
jgi:hypothetical protein